MFPTPPELREELHEAEHHLSSLQEQPAPVFHKPTKGEECLCGCAQRPDNSKKILKIKIIASAILGIAISLVGLNAYQRDAAQASNKNVPQQEVFQNPAGAIQAAETTFPTMIPLNDTPSSTYQQTYIPMQMTPHMATPIAAYQQYNPYPAYPSNYGYQMPNCTNEVRQDLVGQRLKRFVSR